MSTGIGTSPWKRATDLISLTLTPITLDTNMLPQSGVPFDVTAVFDELDDSIETDTTDIRPTNSSIKNSVPISIGMHVRVTTLKRSNSGSKLRALKLNAPYCLVQWVEGTETHAAYCTCGTLESGIRGREQQTITLDLPPFDPGNGIDQYTYSTSA